jgi:rhamnosyltransferase
MDRPPRAGRGFVFYDSRGRLVTDKIEKTLILMNSHSNICAIVVTYHPDLLALESLLAALAGQVAVTVIADNGSSPDCTDWIRSQAGVVPLLLGKNLGVAEAHNHAIRWAKANGFTHVALFDQDSLPAPDMIGQLLAGEEVLSSRGERVAAVGPRYFDPRHLRPAPFIRLDGLKINRIYCTETEDRPGLHRADYLITSGTLIRLSVLDAVGLLDAALFIDYVDIEWGLRAKSMGYRCFGVCAAQMRHSLGDRAVFWRGGKRIIPVHSPLRNYYLFRNAILLYRRSYISLVWALNDAYRLLLKYGFYSLVTSPRLLNFKMMTLGLWHGLRGFGGEFPNRSKS